MTPGGFPDNQGKSPDYSALGNERRHLWQATMNIAATVAANVHNRLQPGAARHVRPSWIWDATREEIVLVNSSFELVPGLPFIRPVIL